MTWINRLKLLTGLLVVLVTVAAATIILNQRESQVASSTASIQALSYSIGRRHLCRRKPASGWSAATVPENQRC